MSKTRFLSVAAAEFALQKLHMTLTILRKNKNTTTTNLLTPTDDLGLAQPDPKNPWSGSNVSRSILQNKNPVLPPQRRCAFDAQLQVLIAWQRNLCSWW